MENTVTKEDFIIAYKKYPLSNIELYFIKNFSIHSIKGYIFAELLLAILLMLPFIFALIGKLLEWPHIITYVPSFIYAALLSIVGIYMLVVWHKKRIRLSKIRKELKISKEHFNQLVQAYFYDRYYSTDKYLKFNAFKS